MIFKEQSSIDLSQYEMLTEDESKVNINTVPIVENSRICTNIVNFDDIERISRDYDISFNESLDLIKKNNNIDNIAVSINDYRIVETPEIVSYFDNVVIKPLSENDIVSVYCEEVCNQYLDSMDESILDNILDENKFTYGLRRARTHLLNARDAVANTVNTTLDNNPNTRDALSWISHGVASYGTHKALKSLRRYRYQKNYEDYKNRIDEIRKQDGNYIDKFKKLGALEKQYKQKDADIKNQHFYLNIAAIPSMAYAQNLAKKILIGSHKDPNPKNFISKAIIKLRRLYKNWLQKAKDARDSKTGNMIKNAASKLLEVIDKLLKKIQNGAEDALG
jgi:hypothetical protein